MGSYCENAVLKKQNGMLEGVVGEVYIVFWTFFLGGVMGFLIETVWCWIDFGEFSSRTSNLFFPFSIVWAMGAVALLVILRLYKSESVPHLFFKSCMFSGLFEFTCGYTGERLLGVTFWDYTEWPLHIGRYVNVFICLLWGALCIIWVKGLYPLWNVKVNHILKHKKGRMVTVFLIIFMVVTNCISGMALLRMNARNKEVAADSKMEIWLDSRFPDTVLQSYFPKMKYINGEKVCSGM